METSDSENRKRRRLDSTALGGDLPGHEDLLVEASSTDNSIDNQNSMQRMVANDNTEASVENTNIVPSPSAPLSIVSLTSRAPSETTGDTNLSFLTPGPPPQLPPLLGLFSMPAVEGRAYNSTVGSRRNRVLPPLSPRSVQPPMLPGRQSFFSRMTSPNEDQTTSLQQANANANAHEVISDGDNDDGDDDDVQIVGVIELVPEDSIPRSLPNRQSQQTAGETVGDTADDDGVVVTGERQLEVIHTPFGSYRTGNHHTPQARHSPVLPAAHAPRFPRRSHMLNPNNSRFRFPASRRDLLSNNRRGRGAHLRVVSTMRPFDINDSRSLHNFYNHIAFPLGDSAFGPGFSELPWNDELGIGSHRADEIEASIMNRIERQIDEEMSEKISMENNYNQNAYLEKQRLTKESDSNKHVSNLDPNVGIYCELCGVELGVGIPRDFKPSPAYDENFKKYQEQFEVLAPWFCVKMITEVDKDLSKRVFSAKCGHVYCGRCVKNIGNRSGRIPKGSPKGSTIDNPLISAPKVCHCSKRFNAKSFTELYI